MIFRSRTFRCSFLLLVALLFTQFSLAFAAAPAQDGPVPLDDPAELETFVDGLIAAQMKAHNVAGVTVSVVKDGEVFFAKGYGYADVARQIPVDPERTLFRIGSVSKLYVWTAVMQLVEQGLLDLDTDVNEYLDFEIPDTFEQPITLRHLLTHTPGFEDNGLGLFVLSEEEVTPFEEEISQNIPTRVFPPGEISAYSNYGAALAGYIVQRVSGLPFDQYAEQNIFQPLGMAHSSFRQPLPDDLAADMSVGYRFTGGEYEPGGFEYVVPYPAGSVSSTAVDQAAFMIAHLQHGQYGQARILQEETARQMHSPQFAYDERLDGWGLGFAVRAEETDAEPGFGHGGDTIFFHSEMLLLPEENVGVFVSTNTDTGSIARFQFLQAFLERYFPTGEWVTAAGDLQPPDPAVQGVYYPTRISFTRMEKVLALVAPVSVGVTEDGRLRVNGVLGAQPTYWVQIEPGLFAPLEGPFPPDARLLIEERTVGGETRQFLLVGSMSYARQPWYAANSLMILILSVVIFLVAVIALPVTGGLSRRYARLAGGARPPEPLPARLARWVGWALALLGLVFWIVFTVFSGDIYNLVFGLPPVLQGAMVIPWIFTALAVVAAGLAVWLWARRVWTLAGRIGYTLLVIAALVQVWFLTFWNML